MRYLIGFTLLLGIVCTLLAIPKHHCKWVNCPSQNSPVLKTDCEPASDCYLIDKLHWEFPAMEYDQLDSILFIRKHL